MIKVTSFTREITAADIDGRPRWESDGACWILVSDPWEAKGWRWAPANWKAFGKPRGPTGEMTDFVIPEEWKK